MRYPVGTGELNDFYSKWYLTDGFGSLRVVGNFSYYHSGVDLNKYGGSSADLGEAIHAISRGRMAYYHRYSHPTATYGRHNVYRIQGTWGVRWVHSAHCLDRDFVGEVKDLAEGEMTGRIGNSGNSTGPHLHFAIFRVDPSTLPRGIDTVPTTVQQLNDWFEDPIAFIQQYYGEEDMNDELLQWLGVNNNDEAMTRLTEHLGEHDGKCDWGNSADDRGGYLGSERRKNSDLTDEVNSLSHQLEICEEQSGGLEPKVPDGWVPNGYETTVYSNGDSSISTNYKKE